MDYFVSLFGKFGKNLSRKSDYIIKGGKHGVNYL